MMRRLNNQGRVLRNIMDFHSNTLPGIVLINDNEEDLTHLTIAIGGPMDTPYHNGTFEFNIYIPSRFPFSAPRVKLQTPIFHPNISYEGDVCVDILSEWAPATTLLEVAEGLQALMRLPNSSSPLNVDASTLMEQDSQLYLDTVLMWTAVHAGGIERPHYLQAKIKTVMEITPWTEDRALQKLSKHGWDVPSTIASRRSY